MQDNKNKVEAILFTTGRFLTLEEISKFCGIASVGYLKDLLVNLKKEYEEKGGALELINEKDKWKLNIKKGYLHLTEKLLDSAEFNIPVQETLAIIAYKQPAVQSEVVKVRGNKSYDHIKVLHENDLITSEKFGRTRILKLTQKFYDYFDVVKDQLVRKFEEVETKVGEVDEEKPVEETKNEEKT